MSDQDEPAFVDATLVKPIVLDDVHGRWEFAPRPDITAYEAVLISQLFTAMVLRRQRLDWREYLTRQWLRPGSSDSDVNPLPLPLLARHFKNVD